MERVRSREASDCFIFFLGILSAVVGLYRSFLAGGSRSFHDDIANSVSSFFAFILEQNRRLESVSVRVYWLSVEGVCTISEIDLRKQGIHWQFPWHLGCFDEGVKF